MEDTASRSGEEETADDQDDVGPSGVPSLPSSSRQMRNQAEKQRRDKLNQLISELATLVPMVSTSPKRLDKTSVLRLSATYIRMHQVLVGKYKEEDHKLAIPLDWCRLMLEGMEGILIVVTSSGKIVFVTHNVENVLGHSQTDLLGQPLYNITSPEDHDALKRNLRPDADVDQPSTSSGTSVLLASDSRMKDPERRSFYLRLRLKSTSKSEQPQYEMMHITGHLRVPPNSPVAQPSKRTAGTSSDAHYTTNEIVLVAMMKPFREQRINEYSILEASREEWISRHLMDGTIVFSDHRISVVSGYMSEEVSGDFGFRYMHQDDVRYVLMALRQMYYRGESYGTSCYRLLAKTGEYIYIRTHGYLELNSDSNSVQSFICINSLVSKEEGEVHIKQMKAMFTPLVAQRDASVAALSEGASSTDSTTIVEPLKVDDPIELSTAIEQLLSDLPADQIHPNDSDAPVTDQQFAKAALASKSFPHVHSCKMGKSLSTIRQSRASPVQPSRPSVITRAKEKRPVVEGDESSTKKLKPETSRGVITLSQSVIRSSANYVTPTPDRVDERIFVPEAAAELPPTPENRVVIHQEIDYSTYAAASPPLSSDSVFIDGPSSSEFLFSTDILSIGALTDRSTDHLDEVIPGATDTLALWESDVGTLEEGVSRSQMQLEDRMQYQESQITAIEENLTSVPMNEVGSHIYRSTFSHLKAEHRKQQQILKTLQQDHQNLQHVKDPQISVRGAQDIGA